MNDDRCRAGKLVELVEEHYELLYRYAYRLSGSAADAEDLTQQTFLTAQKKLHQLRKLGSVKAWLCTILRNSYLKSLGTQNRPRVLSLEYVSEPVNSDPQDVPFDSEELQAVLSDMPEEFRTPVILFYFNEFTYQEIADEMDVPIGTVMSRLARAKAVLRRRLTPPAQAGSQAEPQSAATDG